MVSALTLCPALCAIIIRPSDGTKSAKSINGRVRAAYNASFNAVLGKYKKGVMFFIHHQSLDMNGFQHLLGMEQGNQPATLLPP